MKKPGSILALCLFTGAFFFIPRVSAAPAFAGQIHALIRQGSQTTPLLYLAGTNFLRVEMTTTDRPHPVDILNRRSNELTLLFPHNRSFVRLKPAAENNPAAPPGNPLRPAMPPGIGPRPSAAPGPTGPIGPTNLPESGAARSMPALPQRPAMPQMPINGSMPVMPMMPMPQEKLKLKATDESTNLLGYACTRYELKQRGETMEIWATDRLLPFQPYVQNQPHRFGPRLLEEEWGGMLKAKKLFPLLATLKFDNGVERYRFEVTSITAEKLAAADEKLFEPPTNYFEIQPLPF